MAARYVADGIRVNAIAPGSTVTEFHFGRAADPQARRERMLTEDHPGCLMRRRGRPEEIAAAIAFLASDDASYVTGTVLCVDGGRVGLLAPAPGHRWQGRQWRDSEMTRITATDHCEAKRTAWPSSATPAAAATATTWTAPSRAWPAREVVAVADPDDAGRAGVVQHTGAPRGYADYRELLDRERPDIAVVASREIGDHHRAGARRRRAGLPRLPGEARRRDAGRGQTRWSPPAPRREPAARRRAPLAGPPARSSAWPSR